MKKELIKTRFSKCLDTYNDNATVQKLMAKNLVQMISKDYCDKVLELGCGTGLLTKEVVNKISFNSYVAIDMVNCADYIKSVSSSIHFTESDIETYKTNEKYNLILSNASLQWLDNLDTFIENIKTILDGQFLFTVFGGDNFTEMKSFITSPLKYYSVDELKELLADFDMTEIKESKEILEFSTPLEVLHHIKYTGVNALSETKWTKKDLSEFLKNYPKTDEGKYTLTYHPIYISGKSNSKNNR